MSGTLTIRGHSVPESWLWFVGGAVGSTLGLPLIPIVIWVWLPGEPNGLVAIVIARVIATRSNRGMRGATGPPPHESAAA